MAKGSETGGCLNCYAARMAARNLPELKSPTTRKSFARILPSGPRWTGDVEFIEKALELPLRWKKPRKIFVNSMSDLFHESLSDEVIDRVFAVMALCPQHTFQILSKRPERMLRYIRFRSESHGQQAARIFNPLLRSRWNFPAGRSFPACLTAWPLKNCWLGVSVENQATAEARIPLLLQTPAAKRFISYEPALGPLELNAHRIPELWLGGLHWVVCGGESGPSARPMHPDWARSVRDQCVAAGVPFFFKQWGAFQHGSIKFGGPQDYIVLNDGRYCLETELYAFHAANPDTVDHWSDFRPESMGRVGKKLAGALLDGHEHKEFPNA